MISLMDASVSMEVEVSALPLREEGPPSEASVAADRPGRLREPWKGVRVKREGRQSQRCCQSTLTAPFWNLVQPEYLLWVPGVCLG